MGNDRRDGRGHGSAAKAMATTLKRPLSSRPTWVGSKRVLIFGTCALAALLGVVFTILLVRGADRRSRALASRSPPVQPAFRQLPVIGDVPAFAFADTDGRVIDAQALRGHVWIADFIFTRCTTMCPIITAKMGLLRRSIPSADIRFVSFSIDPEYDTPDVLKTYAARWNADPRWLLLSPPASQIVGFAKALNVPFERTTDRQEPIQHTSQFFLIDRTGHLRGVYGSLDNKAVLRLIADATNLDANTEPLAMEGGKSDEGLPAPSVSRGLALFQALGCGGCHADPKTGPSLAGLAGQTVRLEGGATVTADDAYLRQSILDAGDKVVSGYNPLMPSYRDYLTSPEIDDLVAYLHAIVGTEGAAASPPTREGADVEVQDPVCGMKIKRDRAAAHSDYQGKDYHFCSELCRDRFVANRAAMPSPKN